MVKLRNCAHLPTHHFRIALVHVVIACVVRYERLVEKKFMMKHFLLVVLTELVRTLTFVAFHSSKLKAAHLLDVCAVAKCSSILPEVAGSDTPRSQLPYVSFTALTGHSWLALHMGHAGFFSLLWKVCRDVPFVTVLPPHLASKHDVNKLWE